MGGGWGGVDFCSQSVSLAIVYLSVLELPGVWTRKRQDKNRPRIGPTFKLLQCSRFFLFVVTSRDKRF